MEKNWWFFEEEEESNDVNKYNYVTKMFLLKLYDRLQPKGTELKVANGPFYRPKFKKNDFRKGD